MAQKVQIVLIDDLDGGAADETVLFGLDGQSYEIDLTKANAAKLRDALAVYVGSARKAGRSGRSPSRRPGRGGDTRVAEIRAWAKSQGLKVNERGRVPADIVAKYDAR